MHTPRERPDLDRLASVLETSEVADILRGPPAAGTDGSLMRLVMGNEIGPVSCSRRAEISRDLREVLNSTTAEFRDDQSFTDKKLSS